MCTFGPCTFGMHPLSVYILKSNLSYPTDPYQETTLKKIKEARLGIIEAIEKPQGATNEPLRPISRISKQLPFAACCTSSTQAGYVVWQRLSKMEKPAPRFKIFCLSALLTVESGDLKVEDPVDGSRIAIRQLRHIKLLIAH